MRARSCGWMFACIIVLLAAPVAAQVTARSFLSDISSPRTREIYSYHTSGVLEGYQWMQAELRSSGQPMLFCQPARFTMSFELAVETLRTYLATPEGSELGDFPYALVLLQALKYRFPCATR